jgi:hypothetical protein
MTQPQNGAAASSATNMTINPRIGKTLPTGIPASVLPRFVAGDKRRVGGVPHQD